MYILAGDNTYGQIGDNTKIQSTYYKKLGFVYLDYEEKTVEVGDSGYKIDLNKLKYVTSSINVYHDPKAYTVGQLKFTSIDETIANVDENGIVTAIEGKTGITQIKIEDITNNYETYFTVIINRLENTDTVTYIYNISDLEKFRDSVNAGDNYRGKTVYVMADIDMSTSCSRELGSWETIGTGSIPFAGTFDGNYHKISNLYINASSVHLGFFRILSNAGIIQNVILDNVYIYNSYNSANSYTGGIVGENMGIVQNCGISSGAVIGYQTGIDNIYRGTYVGGITRSKPWIHRLLL